MMSLYVYYYCYRYAVRLYNVRTQMNYTAQYNSSVVVPQRLRLLPAQEEFVWFPQRGSTTRMLKYIIIIFSP